jgi:hypothetical protein
MSDETIFLTQLNLYPKVYLDINTTKKNSGLNVSPENEEFPYFP